MKHLTNINDIEQTIEDNRICLFYIKAPDCGVCNVMLDKVEQITTDYPAIASFYTDITEEPLIAGRFLVFCAICLAPCRVFLVVCAPMPSVSQDRQAWQPWHHLCSIGIPCPGHPA